MTPEDVKELQKVASKHTRKYMFDFVRKRKDIIDQKMAEIEAREIESEENYWKELLSEYDMELGSFLTSDMLESEYNDYFINYLNEGNSIKTCFMVHNAYWPSLEKLNNHFNNCQIDTFGSSPAYLNSIKSDADSDYDLLILSSNGSYSDYDIQRLKNMAKEISKKKDKRVTIGYKYFIPKEDRENKTHTEELEIISFKSGNNDYKETILIMNKPFSIIDFLNYTTAKHNEMATNKILRK